MKNKYKLPRFYKSAFLILTLAVFKLNFIISCVEPISLRTKGSEEKLVVEGLITNRPDEYKVRLTLSANYGKGSENFNSWVNRALVSIVDDQDKEHFLIPKGQGFFSTTPGQLQGEVGRTYKLRVKTRLNIYESRPQKLNAVPKIDSIYYEYKPETEFEKEGVYTYIDLKDEGNSEYYYRWDYDRIRPTLTCGFDEASKLGRICCEPVCFETTKCYSCIDVMSNHFFKGQTIKKRLITIDPYDGRKEVYIKVYQQSITKEAYNYLSAINQQNKNTGSVFDTPPFPIKGNMFNINNPDEVVLGYFGVAGEYIADIKIVRENIPVPPKTEKDLNAPFCPPGNCPPCAPCGELLNTSTTPPASWYK